MGQGRGTIRRRLPHLAVAVVSLPLTATVDRERGHERSVSECEFCLQPLRVLPPMSGGSRPLRWVSIGLGSKGSACDGPPFMNRKMMCFARAGKSVGCGASGPAATGVRGEGARRGAGQEGE